MDPDATRVPAREPGVLCARDPADGARLRTWLRLQAALGFEPQRAADLLRRFGDAGGALRAAGVAPRTPRIPSEAGDLDAQIAVLARVGAVAVPLTADSYPARLRALPDPAPLLLVRGSVDVLALRCVAVVGARAATRYGLDVARELAGDLTDAGCVVVSGLARGVDAAAHRGALERGGVTVAFQACGPERVYPREHRGLAGEICESGAVVTEMPPGTPPLAHYFPLRNRLIAGLAEVVVVVEARARSGSLVTARRALDHGGDVMAVPGRIRDPTSEGTNRLLAEGAAPVRGAEDVLRALGIEPPARHAAKARRLPAAVARIVEALREAPATRDELGRRLGRSPEDLALDLLELELSGQIATERDGRLRVRI